MITKSTVLTFQNIYIYQINKQKSMITRLTRASHIQRFNKTSQIHGNSVTNFKFIRKLLS